MRSKGAGARRASGRRLAVLLRDGIALLRAIGRDPRLLWSAAGAFLDLSACRSGLGPSARYLRFRAEVAYGDPEASPTPEDVASWLRWRRQERRRLR